jgi:hypothetical protein
MSASSSFLLSIAVCFTPKQFASRNLQKNAITGVGAVAFCKQ